MNTDILEGKWTQVRGQVQERWGELTDDDLEQIKGKRKQLEGKLRERYGYNKKQAKSEVDQFVQEANGRATKATEKVQAKVHEAQDMVQTRVKEAQEKLQERAEMTREKVSKGAEQARDEIRNVVPEDVVYVVDEYPWLVIIGALLMGVVIGLLLGPNRS